MDYKVIFLDIDGRAIAESDQCTSISFSWAKYSGCAQFDITLARRFDNYDDIVQINNWVQIYVDNTLWYSGLIQDYTTSLAISESVSIVGIGFSEQLSWSDETWTYRNIEVSALASFLVQNRITSNGLNIIHDPSNFVDTAFTINTIVFNVQRTKDCLQALKELTPYYDYGVDQYRYAYFKPIFNSTYKWDQAKWDQATWESSKPNIHTFVSKELESYEPMTSSSQIVNRILLVGGKKNSNENYFYLFEDVDSIKKYKVREKRESQQSIVTDWLAEQWCKTRLQELSVPSKRVTINLKNYMSLIKPNDMIQVRDDNGNIIDSHLAISVNYTIDDSGLSTSIECDRPIPNLAFDFRMVKRDIEALQTQNQEIQSYLIFYEDIPNAFSYTGNNIAKWDSAIWDVDTWVQEQSEYTLTLKTGIIIDDVRTVAL